MVVMLTAYCLLLTAYCLLLTAYCLLRSHVSLIASKILLRVSGASVRRRPVALAMALAMAAAVGMMGGSPAPLEPMWLASVSGTSRPCTTISGASAAVSIL